MNADQIDNNRDQAIQRKAKRLAWITGFGVPALYILASSGVIAHAGLGGLATLFFFYLPLTPICAVVLRALLAPAYRALLDRKVNSRMRRLLAVALVMLAAVFCGLLIKTIFFPYDTVNRAIKNIPEIEQYFTAHRDEIEERRLQTDGGEKEYAEFYLGYSGFLQITFCYKANRSVGMGYQSSSCYRYALDEHWYIEILLMEAH